MDGHAPVYLLVLDVFRTRRAHALDHEVECILLVVADAVVVDGGAEEFARSGRKGLEHQRLVRSGQAQRAAARAIRDAHDDRGAPAVLEELLDGVGKRGWLPQAAENALELVETGDAHGTIHGPAQAPPDKGRNGRRCFGDGLA